MNPLDNLLKGDKRSVKAKKNILASAFIKGADTLVYLLLVPLTLGYLNAYEYGIWLTLNSFLSWINALDIGLGSGLRNRLGEAIAKGDKEKGRAYVSTTFFMLFFITLVLFTLSSIVIINIDWYKVLSVDHTSVRNLGEILLVSLFFFCVNFVVKFVGNVYQAMQLPAVNYLISFSGHLLSLIIIYALTKFTSGNLFLVALVYSASPPLIYIICYPLTFFKYYSYLTPSFAYFKKIYLKDLLSLSILFFILQIMGIVLFSISNVLISNMFGPENVTPYNIAYRYYSVIIMLFTLMLAPIWSATTDAYAQGDMDWINRSMNKMSKIMFLTAAVIVVMIMISPYAFTFWVGKVVSIPISLSIFMGIYAFILMWSLCFSTILNGMGLLRIQIINIVIVAMLFYPLCLYLGKIYNLQGVVMAMCLLNIPGAVLNTIQIYKVIHHKAYGIWLK